ncbi:MAG TPA: hypothetical protein VGK74_11790 [Symbiobacteriaceae bacterium]
MRKFIPAVLTVLLLLQIVSTAAQAAPVKQAVPPAPKEIKGAKLVKADVAKGVYDYEVVRTATAEDGQVSLGYHSGKSDLAVCGTPWENVLIADKMFAPGDKCNSALPPGIKVAGYENLDPATGKARQVGSVVYYQDTTTGNKYKDVLIPCLFDPFGGCTNAWNSWVPWWETWQIFSFPGESCAVLPYPDPLPELPIDEMPVLPVPDPGVRPPQPPVPGPTPTTQPTAGGLDEEQKAVEKWGLDLARKMQDIQARAASPRKASASGGTANAASGSNDVCSVPSTVVFNGDEFQLNYHYPIINKGGKHFYPATIESIQSLGLGGWYGRTGSWFGGGDRLVYIASQNTVVVFDPKSGWTLWDLQLVRNGTKVGDQVLNDGGIEAFRADGDREVYYFDLDRVLQLLGGWMVGKDQSADGKYHIGIPDEKGSWLRSCEMRGFKPADDTIKNCPIDVWMPGSTWQYYSDQHGPSEAIGVAQGLVLRNGLRTGVDPADKFGLRFAIKEDWAPFGLAYEGDRYSSFWTPLLGYAEDTAWAAFGAAVDYYGTKYLNQIHRDPAKTATIAEKAIDEAAEEYQALGAGTGADQELRRRMIEDYILEAGLNLDESGKPLPVSISPAELAAPGPGRYARVYGPKGYPGFIWQMRITGQPAPRLFKIPGDPLDKTYVGSFEYGTEPGGRWQDGLGRFTWPDPRFIGRIGIAETKAGYNSDRYINPKTGDFYEEFGEELDRWLANFQQDVFKAQALGIEMMQIFTQQKTADLFIKHAEERFGKEFMDQNRYRVVVTTKQVMEPLKEVTFPLEPPSAPTPTPCPPMSICSDAHK